MKRIAVTQGKFALVDDENYEWLNQYKWSISKGYPARRLKRGNKTHISMHRLIMNFPKGKEIDHINGNRLDNRKVNLRIVTRAGNMQNRGLSKVNKTGFKGIYFFIPNKKWQAHIRFNRKKIHLGYFVDKKEAARAYNWAALKYFGQYANINIL